MTFDAIKKAIKDHVNLSSSEADTRVGESINRHYKRITSLIGMDTTRFVTRSATTTNGVQTVEFSDLEKIDRVLDTTASSSIRLLTEVDIHAIRSAQPGTGSPGSWAPQINGGDSVTILLDTLPQTTYSLQADGWTTLADLEGTDSPAFPESFHDILTWSVLAEELLKKEKIQLASAYEIKAKELLAALNFHFADSPTKETRQGSSTLGSSLGAGGGTGSSTLGGTAYTQSSLLTFDRGAGIAPFAVAQSDAATVANLDADKLDEQHGAYYLDRAHHTGVAAFGVSDINPIATDRLVGRDSPGPGQAEEIAVTSGLAFTGSLSLGIAANGVTYALMQDVTNASRLLGRGSASSSGDPEEISLGAGLTLAATTLSNTHAANQSANTGLLGPATGIPAAPAFRAFVLADIQAVLPGALYRVGTYNNATQTLLDTTDTALTFNTHDYATGSVHDTVTNPTRFTAVTSGLYEICATCSFAASGTGFRWMYLRKNGTTVVSGGPEAQGHGSFQNMLCLSVQVVLTAADYVEVMAVQTSGGVLAVGHATTRQFQNSAQFARIA